jgi:glycosyltransferase involved in cell wall biosynthesis
MIKVLNLFTTLDNGGVESFLYNYYSNMNHNLIHYDFIVPGFTKGFLEKRFICMGSQVFHVPTLHQNAIKQIYQIVKIIKNGEYDVIHCHGYKSSIGLLLGKILGVKVRILHSHMSYEKHSLSQILIILFAKMFCTKKMACGIDAACWLFGQSDYESGNVTVVNNAINVNKYLFDKSRRAKVRESLNLSDEFVIGHVGRLTYQKNQSFLIDVTKKILNKIPSVRLIFVGNGEDFDILREKVIDMKISDEVKFLGTRSDIPDLLSAFDVFAFPSKFEGLPVVLVESQASGLISLVSNYVTKEIKVSNNLRYLPLDIDLWVETLFNIYLNKQKNLNNRKLFGTKMVSGPYDITSQVEYLMSIYQKEVSK